MSEPKDQNEAACGGSALTAELAADVESRARAAFVAKIKEENFYLGPMARQSLKAHWAGSNGGFSCHMVQRRWRDFLAGFKAAND